TAAFAIFIAMDIDATRYEHEFIIVKIIRIGRDQNMRRAIARKAISENMHIAVRHHHDAGAGRNAADNIALGRKVRRVIIHDLIVEDANVVPALLRQVGQIENQNADRIVLRAVAINIGAEAVLDLDTANIISGKTVSNDDVLTLADIDARIRRSTHRDDL